MNRQLFCLPENDQNLRYFLSKKGKNNILVIGLNPSTANADSLDPTSKNVDQIATANDYDGWVLANITPERQTHPSILSIEEHVTLLSDNTNLLEAFLIENTLNVKDVLLAWGDLDHYFNQPYLQKYAYIILDRLQKYDLNYLCIKKTKSGHPFHPSTQSLNCHVGKVEDIILKPFEVKSYMKMLKTKFKIK
jgi:hypothetical protein